MKKIIVMLVAIMMSLSLTACFGSKVTQENYDKIEVADYSLLDGYTGGMTYDEVEKILGDPTSEVGTTILTFSATAYTWTDDSDSEAVKSITVSFINDQAVLKVPVGLE